MKNISDTFCVLPWIHLASRPSGDVRLCCVAKGRVTNQSKPHRFGTDKIEHIWNSDHMRNVRQKMINGEQVEACQRCYNIESFGNHSKRITSNQTMMPDNINDMISYSKINDGEALDYPSFYDLRFGNLCNLKCRMCSPQNSSQIQKEIALNPIDMKILEEYVSDDINEWFLNDNFWKDLEKYIPYIDHLYFTGGEPTLIEQQYILLEEIIKRGYNDRIQLRYNTNVTNVQPRFLNLINQFERVNLSCSIDGVGRINDYIRHPSNWKNISENFNKFLTNTSDNVDIYVTFTVQALNILYLYDMQQWINEINITTNKKVLLSLNILFEPKSLSIEILTEKLRKEALLLIDKIDTTYIIEDGMLISIKNKLKSPEPSDILKLRNKFKKHMSILDTSRNENLLDTMPELSDLVKD